MKDDIGSLIEAIKQGQGTLKRMTAMYLLWHHVLHDPAKRTEAIQVTPANVKRFVRYRRIWRGITCAHSGPQRFDLADKDPVFAALAERCGQRMPRRGG